MFDTAAPASNTRLEEATMSTATLTAVTLAGAPLRTRPVTASSAPRLVLTPRGRRTVRGALWLAVTGAVAVLLVLAWLGLAATVAPGASAGDGGEGVTSGLVAEAGTGAVVEVVVGPGDTLWQLARTHAPGRDPRSVVAEIVALNGLGSTGVQAGAVLEVPAA